VGTVCSSCSITDYKLIDIYNEIENIDIEKLSFLLDGAKMNLDMAKEGMDNEYGMNWQKNKTLY
jgi:L-cysteine desulfidase